MHYTGETLITDGAKALSQMGKFLILSFGHWYWTI
jgi:hypothetical protein